MNICYIEFEIYSEEKLKRLENCIETIKKDKKNNFRNIEAKWILLFNDEELNTFWWPNELQYEQTKKNFGDVYIKVISKKENEQGEWDIYSMFDAILNGEYEIFGIKKLNETKRRLEFYPFAYPYGGTGSMEKLVKSYGHKLTTVYNGAEDAYTVVGNKSKNEINKEKIKKWWKFW